MKTPTENEVFIEMEKRSSTVLENLAQKIKQRKYSRAKKFGNFERNIEKNTEFERILRKYVLTVQMINKKLENRDVKAKHLNKKYSYSSENLIINKNIVFHDDLMLEILKRHID